MMQGHSDQFNMFESIIHALPESVYAKNKEGYYLSCSQRMVEMVGYASPADVVGKTDYDLIWHAHADELRANDLEVMESRKTLVFEERGHTALKEVMIVRTIKSPLLDSHGEVVGIVGISFDLTDLFNNTSETLEKIAAENAMQRMESTYLKEWYEEVSGQHIKESLSLDEIGNKIKTYMEGIIDKLPANIYWMDLNGRVLGCNQQMAKLTGFQDRQEAIGRDVSEHYFNHHAFDCLDNNLEAQKNDGILVFEESAIIDGQERVFLSHKSALRDNNGEPISLLGVSFDITERKQMERELKLAKEAAEAANLAKMHFMNNMRHDLRTPLSCVVGSARVLKALETDPEKSEFIEGILRSSQSLLQMLTNMLEFDHIQSKEKTVEFQPVKITKLGQDLVEMLQLTAKGKGLSLFLQLAPETPETISSDSYRLQRILMNLMNNAIKFTHQGSVTLRMEAREKEFRVSVHDTGIGIDPKRKHEVFDKFVRLVDSDKGLYDGEGLGLAIVKQFVEELEGQIALETEEGLGSTFTVTLPLRM